MKTTICLGANRAGIDTQLRVLVPPCHVGEIVDPKMSSAIQQVRNVEPLDIVTSHEIRLQMANKDGKCLKHEFLAVKGKHARRRAH